MPVLGWRRHPRTAKSRVRRVIETSLCVLAALTIRWVILDAYVIPSGSMLPSLLIGDRHEAFCTAGGR